MALLTDSQPASEGRLRGRPRRAFSVSTKLTAQEFEVVSAASQNSGKAIGEWAREALIREANGTQGHASNEMLMTELIGLQIFLTNVLAPIARGEAITSERYQDLMRHVRLIKHNASSETIAKYRSIQNDAKAR